MIVFLDTEFTDFVHPQLLSLGMVALNGSEHYVELDLGSDVGQARVEASSDFVRYEGVLDLWGRVPGATATALEMGRRSGEWLLAVGRGERIELAFDYATDYELLAEALRDCDLWEQVRPILLPVDVGHLCGRLDAELACEECLRELMRRRLTRHHALADALALRAAFVAVQKLWT